MRQVINPPNPYLKYSTDFLGEPPQQTKLQVFEEYATKSVISKSNFPGMGERFIVNCYRGCMHGCTYCFARRYHELLDFGCGTDFETKIVVKPNAPKVLREELKRSGKNVPHLEFSFATDPYLPLEAHYELTRQCLAVCADLRMPVGIMTKSPLITRDLDILTKLKSVSVYFSIPFYTKEKSNPFEPYVPVPEVRFRAMETLANAGIAVGVAIAPVIPGYSESEIPRVLERAYNCGARAAFMNMIHFDTDSILDYFLQKLHERVSPTRAQKIINTIKRERGGNLRHRNWDERSAGKTEQWDMTRKLFDFHYKRLGFGRRREEETEVVDILEEEAEIVQQKLF
ncbi:MAG TPA: radical SAM protein [Pyrinomonadaceae bacterium]|jgi:DNA repair photolyase|nr:radical SAM protein [Pyrinomonadaceae bacterium]